MKIAYDDARCYQNLIYAVIARAMMDTFKVQPKGELCTDTRTAFDFLFGNDVDVWLELVDLDPEHFKRKLKDSMFSESCSINDVDKRCFRINYKTWYQEVNAPRLLALGYKTWRK